VQLRGQSGLPQLHGDWSRVVADDSDSTRDPGADVGYHGGRHHAGGHREDVVRPRGKAIGRWVGPDYDEQIHGDMLAHLRALCIEIVDLRCPFGPPSP
jgi:hypothetical protein